MPLIVAGPGVAGRPRRRHAGVAHRLRADDPRGAGLPPRVGGRRAARRVAVRAGERRDRRSAPVISEYHAIGSVAGAFMLRFGQWKYCHYVGASAAALRPRRRSRGTGRSRRRPAVRRHARRRRAAAARGARSGSGRRARQAAPGASCSRNSAAARRRSRAATWASRRRRAPPPEIN